MSPVPPPLPYDEALRQRIVANLAGHERRVLALDERRHAAVAIVVVDSTEGEDRVDPFEPECRLDGHHPRRRRRASTGG